MTSAAKLAALSWDPENLCMIFKENMGMILTVMS